MIDSNIGIEIHELHNNCLFGLQWGQAKQARQMGFKRKDVISALNWADNNQKEALLLCGYKI